jgi:4-amino-4-deoxy-L-arabinose transferase-like glycosyltransferase
VTNNQSFLAIIVILASLFVLATALIKRRNLQEKSALKLLTFWLVFGVGLFGFYQKGIYDYYFGFMFPLPFLLTAFALVKIAQLGRLAIFGSVLLTVSLLVVNFLGIPFRYPPNNQVEQAKKIAGVVFAQTAGKPFNFALITGQNSDHAYRYFLEIWGNKPVMIENFENDPARKTVTDQLLVVCESLPCSPEGHPLWEIAGFGRAKVEGVWDVSFVKVYKLRHWQPADENL